MSKDGQHLDQCASAPAAPECKRVSSNEGPSCDGSARLIDRRVGNGEPQRPRVSSGADAGLDALCEEAVRIVCGSADSPRLGVAQLRAALRKVFVQLGRDRVPQPNKEWFDKVFQNYAPRRGGAMSTKDMIDVAKQYCAHHGRKREEQQSPITGHERHTSAEDMPARGPQLVEKRQSGDAELQRAQIQRGHQQQPLQQQQQPQQQQQQQQQQQRHRTSASLDLRVVPPRGVGEKNMRRKTSEDEVVPQMANRNTPDIDAALRHTPDGEVVVQKRSNPELNGPPQQMPMQSPALSPCLLAPAAGAFPLAPAAGGSPSAPPPLDRLLTPPAVPAAAARNTGGVELASAVMFPINCERMAIFERYEFEAGQLGEGSFGRVCGVRDRMTNQRKACKTIGVRDMQDWQLVMTEIEVLKKVDHPNIMRFSECFVDGRNIYMISELCRGGALLEGFAKRGVGVGSAEVAAAACLQQILGATAYCHGKGIIHRDLKPDNVLYVSNEQDSAVKVIDFGLADVIERLVTPRGSPMQRVGTFVFMAPEMLSKCSRYSEKVDLWATGCILFLLVTGVHPFWTKRMRSQDVKARIAAGQVLEHRNWIMAPLAVRDLVMRLLAVDPHRRLSAVDAMKHHWITSVLSRAHGYGQQPSPGAPREGCSGSADPVVPASVFLGLREYQASSKLKKAVLKLLAKEVDEARIQKLREHFKALDKHQDGFLTRDELFSGMRQHLELRHLTPADLALILPSGSNERLSCNDFIAALLSQREAGFSRAELVNAFRRFDVHQEGRISMGALSEVLKNAGPTSLVEAFCEADADHDGAIDFEDFCALINS